MDAIEKPKRPRISGVMEPSMILWNIEAGDVYSHIPSHSVSGDVHKRLYAYLPLVRRARLGGALKQTEYVDVALSCRGCYRGTEAAQLSSSCGPLYSLVGKLLQIGDVW